MRQMDKRHDVKFFLPDLPANPGPHPPYSILHTPPQSNSPEGWLCKITYSYTESICDYANCYLNNLTKVSKEYKKY